MRLLSILTILLSMGVLPYQPPVHHVFTMDYERQMAKQAHKYHGILNSHWPDLGEAYFKRDGKRCKLITTIKRWEVVL